MRIKKAEYLDGYKIKILFNDNKEKIVDLENELYDSMYKPLKNIKYFARVFVDPDQITLQWPNGEDFSPDYLYKIGKEAARTKKETRKPISKRSTTSKAKKVSHA